MRDNGAFGAAVDPTLLTRLDLKTGDRVSIGNAMIELRAALTAEPDKLAGGIGLGPRVPDERSGVARHRACCSPAAWCAGNTGFGCRQRQRAMRGHWRRSKKQAQAEFPEAGWEIRSRSKASPQLERNVERFSQFLTLVGLTTLLVGGVGVANAVASHLARKRDVIATMKALGATGGGVFADLSAPQIMLVALFATLARRRSRRSTCHLRSCRSFGAIIPLPVAPALHSRPC